MTWGKQRSKERIAASIRAAVAFGPVYGNLPPAPDVRSGRGADRVPRAKRKDNPIAYLKGRRG